VATHLGRGALGFLREAEDLIEGKPEEKKK
jgi:hypothetical protein